jgi:hypothetical protein
MKITTKCIRLKHLMLFLIISNLFLGILTERMNTIASFKSNYKLMKGKNSNKKKTSSNDPLSLKLPDNNKTPEPTAGELIKKAGDDLPDMPIYFQGWIKYFRYIENGTEKPSKFFKNQVYEKQSPPSENDKDDDFGSKKIPSEKHFFFVIYKDTANVLTSRENPLMTINDSLIIDFVKTIPEDNNFAGGVKDFGKFSEGACFEINTVKPGAFFKMSADQTEPAQGLKEIWLICSDDEKQKNDMMNIIVKLKLKKQHALGAYISTPSDPNLAKKKGLNPANSQPTVADLINGKPGISDPDKLNDPNKKPEDGTWIVLNNWTPCTLKCGGGLQYLQLMCIPPKNGGKPCQGEAIRTKPCNPQPCPSVSSMQSILPSGSSPNPTTTIEKPIVKVMPISKRPQRYDKCYLKDGDALMIKRDSETVNLDSLPKIPIRLVMNNKSISVYQDETLQTNLMTFILSATSLSRVKGDNRCFILNGLNTKAQFCQLDSQGGNFVEEWDYDFNLLKYQFKQKRDVVELEKSEEKKLESDFERKVQQLKLDMVEKKASKVKQAVENKEEVKLQKKIEQTQAMTLQAIQKELKLEEMLEREEEQKEKDQEVLMQQQLESEKKKNECLTKTLKEKQIEDQMNLSKSNAEEAIAKIKEEAKKQIMVKRAEMKKRLETMRKKNKRKLSAMQNDIVTVRMETAQKVQKIAKVGNQKNCFNPSPILPASLPKMEEYCQANFVDNNAKFMDCKNPESFCFVCCESEFGDMHIPEREKCYKEVCESNSSTASSFVLQS